MGQSRGSNHILPCITMSFLSPSALVFFKVDLSSDKRSRAVVGYSSSLSIALSNFHPPSPVLILVILLASSTVPFHLKEMFPAVLVAPLTDIRLHVHFLPGSCIWSFAKPLPYLGLHVFVGGSGGSRALVPFRGQAECMSNC